MDRVALENLGKDALIAMIMSGASGTGSSACVKDEAAVKSEQGETVNSSGALTSATDANGQIEQTEAADPTEANMATDDAPAANAPTAATEAAIAGTEISSTEPNLAAGQATT